MVNRWRLGGINYGIKEWLFQRLTSVYIGLFGLFIVSHTIIYPVTDYPQWLQRMSHPFVKIGWVVFIFSLLFHGWLGMRSVLLDYAKPLWFRLILNAVSSLFFLALGVWALQILF